MTEQILKLGGEGLFISVILNTQSVSLILVVSNVLFFMYNTRNECMPFLVKVVSGRVPLGGCE